MYRPADTPQAFRERWNGWLNFPLAGSLIPFSYEFPPLDRRWTPSAGTRRPGS